LVPHGTQKEQHAPPTKAVKKKNITCGYCFQSIVACRRFRNHAAEQGSRSRKVSGVAKNPRAKLLQGTMPKKHPFGRSTSKACCRNANSKTNLSEKALDAFLIPWKASQKSHIEDN